MLGSWYKCWVRTKLAQFHYSIKIYKQGPGATEAIKRNRQPYIVSDSITVHEHNHKHNQEGTLGVELNGKIIHAIFHLAQYEDISLKYELNHPLCLLTSATFLERMRAII